MGTKLTRKQRLLPRRVSGAAFLFVVCWMAAAGMWLLYGEPVFGEGRGELLSPELAADSGASTSEASSRQSFAHVRVPDIMEAGAPVDRDFVGEHFSEQPSSDITPPKGNTAESEAAGPTYTVTFSTSDYVGLELTPVWGEGQSTTSTFEIQHISPQSALRGHLCAGDVLVSHEWIDKPVVTGREAARALEKAIFGGLDVPLKFALSAFTVTPSWSWL